MVAKKARVKVPKIGETVVVRYFVPGYPVGLSAESWVEVVEKAKGCGPGRVRVKSASGGLYWLSREAYRLLGEAE